MLGIVALMAITIVFSIALLPLVVDDVDNQNANKNNQVHQAFVKWKPLDLSMGRKFYKAIDFFIFFRYA